MKKAEGGSMRWVVEEAVRQVGKVPDVIIDLGDWGKEPMISMLGRRPDEVL
ncbi:MAG: thiamine-phosphate synthase family protein [Pyrobaculum sp.]